MNKYQIFGAAVIVAAATTAVQAAPFASQIKLVEESFSLNEGSGTISYVLNQDADSVTIEILDAADAVLATFAGTATSGVNSVSWDGTDTNAGGTALGESTGLKIRVTADKDNGTAWSVAGGNEGVGDFGPTFPQSTLFEGYSGKEIYAYTDPTSDNFGTVLGASSYFPGSAIDHSGYIVFSSDLSVSGDGFASRVMNHPTDPLVGTATGGGSQNVWGTTPDPENPENFYVVGQGTPYVMYADNASGFTNALVDIDPSGISSIYPRGVAASVEASVKYLYIVGSTSRIEKCALDANNEIVSAFNIIDTTVAPFDGGLYSKAAEIDAAGNLYYVVRYDNSGTGEGGRLYRWDAATVQAITSDSDPKLTAANATWAVTVPAASTHVAAFSWAPDGSAYLAVSGEGIYSVGNISDATNTTALTSAELVVDFATILGTAWGTSSFGTNMGVDFGGNLIVTDNGTEAVAAFAGPGTSNLEVVGNKTFDIVLETNASTWGLYQ